MASFQVHGPFPIGWEKRKGGRTLLFESFWRPTSDAFYLAGKQGCYVFAIRNKTLTPVYVGKATRTFKQKTFSPSNKHKYNDGFSEYGKGTPVIYFVVLPKNKGPINAKQIAQVEDFLIQSGVAKNPGIQNVRGAQTPLWSIKGVIRHGAGKPSVAESQFAVLFDIRR